MLFPFSYDNVLSLDAWLQVTTGASQLAASRWAPVDIQTYVFESCQNSTEASALANLLALGKVDTNIDPALALASHGVFGHMITSSCLAARGLIFLHWAEKLAAAMLPSPIFRSGRMLEVLLLHDMRKYVSMAWEYFFELKNLLGLEQLDSGGHIEAYAYKLARISTEMQSIKTSKDSSSNALSFVLPSFTEVLALFCGGLRGLSPDPIIEASARFGWRFRLVVPSAESNTSENTLKKRPHISGKAWLLDACMRAYEKEVLNEQGTFAVALLWSPLAEAWEPRHPLSQQHVFWNINALATKMRESENAWPIVGFPSLSSKGLVWPVKRVRWQYWKLHYFDGPSGHAGIDDGCFLGDSTSATRLVLADVFRLALPADGSTWLSAIDLAVLNSTPRQEPRVLTCPTVVTYEADWLQYARLNKVFAVSHQIEVARWAPTPKDPEEYCLALSSEVAERLVKYAGVVTPWCFRRQLSWAIDAISGWWRVRRSSNIVGVTGGSMLALMRGHRPMPWDHDADLLLLSREEFQFRENIESVSLELSMLGCLLTVGGDAVDEGFVVAKVSCADAAGVVATLDIFFQGGDHELDLRAWVNQDWVFETNLLASRIHVEASYFFGLAADPRFAKKMIRSFDGMRSLQCFSLGHNACLPNCTSTQLCEFEDNFVHVDSWLE